MVIPVNQKKIFSPARNQDGIALIMALWIITILSMVVLEFSFAMRTEVHIAKNFQEETQLYAMAEGGVQRAVAELVYKHDPKVQEMRKTLNPNEIPPDKREWLTDGRDYKLQFDQGVCEVRIIGEGGKVNINLVSETMLRKITTNVGVKIEANDTVVDSILDWRDADDLYRVNGAENDYYRSLKEPYDCKNGPLDAIEELLLVKGITPDLFYGKKFGKKGEGEEKVDPVGLKDIFSIYATGEQIDINSAPLPVLKVVLGIPGEIARLIVSAREEKGFESQQDLLLRVPELTNFYGEIGRLIIFRTLTPYSTLESRAKGKEGGSVRGLKVIIKVDPKEKGGHKIIQWLDFIV
jgi:general secretion pathway protein K